MTFSQFNHEKRKNKERGIALMVALFALLLLGAVAMAMTFMADTETGINANYRDAQMAYFGSQGGLEEARERLRINGPIVDLNNDNTSDKITPPDIMPTTTVPAGKFAGVIYIVNPNAADGSTGVQPWNPANAYFDDELCHESFTSLSGMATSPLPTVPCPGTVPTNSTPAAGDTGSAYYRWYASVSPGTGTNAALPFKWVRITLKANASSSPYNVGPTIGSSATPDAQVCWHGPSNSEYLLTRNGGLTPISETEDMKMARLRSMALAAANPAAFFFTTNANGTMANNAAATTSTAAAATTTAATTTASATTTAATTGTTTTAAAATTTGTTTTAAATTGTTTTAAATTTTGTTTTAAATTTTGTTTTAAAATTTGTTTAAAATTGTTTTTGSSSTTGGATAGGTSTTTTGVALLPANTAVGETDLCQKRSSSLYSVYLITSLAVTRNGSRRMTQYEIARSQIALNMPAAMTFNGNPAYFDPPTSAAFEVNGNDNNCGDPLNGGPPKVALGGLNLPGCTDLPSPPTTPAPATQCASDYLYDVAQAKRPNGYVSAVCSSNPCTGDVTSELNNGAQNLATRAGLEDLVAGITAQADQVVTDPAQVTDWGTQDNPKVIVINNDRPKDNPATTNVDESAVDPLSSATDGEEARIPSGYGVLVVRGMAYLGGNQAWHGAVLVVGDGRLRKDGGGGGETYGGMMVANTRWTTNALDSHGDPLASTKLPDTQVEPGPPWLDWNGGGNALIKFDSCALNNGTRRATYGVLAYREMTY
jgi:hypothetical protein